MNDKKEEKEDMNIENDLVPEEETVTDEQAYEEDPKDLEKDESKDRDEYYDKFIRLYSDFENFRRRTLKEKAELITNANASLVAELLPVLDDLERALDSMKLAENEDVLTGVELIYNKLKRTLVSKGLKEMEAIGEPFDPDMHEALTKIQAPNDEMKGKVVDQVEKGYLLNDKIIRHAKVIVGQ
ncbi:MAG: nucleotide exchange factor GrpE [Bacteroidia bacterium]